VGFVQGNHRQFREELKDAKIATRGKGKTGGFPEKPGETERAKVMTYQRCLREENQGKTKEKKIPSQETKSRQSLREHRTIQDSSAVNIRGG